MSFPTPRRQSSGHLLPEVSTISPPSLSHARVQLDMRWTFDLRIGRLSQIRVIFQGARKSLSVAPSPSTRICRLQLAVSSL